MFKPPNIYAKLFCFECIFYLRSMRNLISLSHSFFNKLLLEFVILLARLFHFWLAYINHKQIFFFSFYTYYSHILENVRIIIEALFLQIQNLINTNLGDEFGDMGDENHRAVVFIERGGDDRYMAEIYMIGRLIQYQKPGFLKH